MQTKSIRIWNGPTVICNLTVGDTGYSITGPSGGASNSTAIDIEIDPFAGNLVDRQMLCPRPIGWRDEPEAEPLPDVDAINAQHVKQAQTKALIAVLEALDSWIEGVRENCVVSQHNHGDRLCGDMFHVNDLRSMINDAARDLDLPAVYPQAAP